VSWNGQQAANTVQRGVFAFASVAAGDTTIVAVTFPAQFAAAPVITTGAASSGGVARFLPAWANVTTAGFTLVVTNVSGGASSGVASWTAIS
jgi:hypothetical protein